MQETLYQTADAGVSPSDSRCRSISIRQRIQEFLHQTADTETLNQTADRGDFLSDTIALYWVQFSRFCITYLP